MNSDSTLRGFSVRQLSDMVGGDVQGDGTVHITGINRIEFARQGELTFVASEKYVKFLSLTQASCVIVSKDLASYVPAGRTIILADDAYRAFVIVMQHFFPPLRMEEGLRHPAASIHPSARVHPTASVGAGCVVSEGCDVGPNVQMFANVVLYPGTRVGDGTIIHANVVCAAGTRIGAHCIVHAGAIIGSDGFGFLENTDGSYEKIPQVGIVEVGDHVEIGANTTIDRAAVGKTLIGNGVKLDNLVHIAHGVTVGDNTAIAAQAGISGSTRLGERNRIAGQVGVVGHISTASDVVIEAQSGVSKSITTSGAYFGSPAKEHKTAIRMEAALRQLPQLLQEFRELQRRVEELTSGGTNE